MNTWKEECYYLLEILGGKGRLANIYKAFEEYGTRPKIKSYRESIRDALEKGCRESVKFDGKELFFMPEGKHGGYYAIVKK